MFELYSLFEYLHPLTDYVMSVYRNYIDCKVFVGLSSTLKKTVHFMIPLLVAEAQSTMFYLCAESGTAGLWLMIYKVLQVIQTTDQFVVPVQSAEQFGVSVSLRYSVLLKASSICHINQNFGLIVSSKA